MATQTLDRDRELQLEDEADEARWGATLTVDYGLDGDSLELRLLDALFPGEMDRVNATLAMLDAAAGPPPF